MLVGNGLTNWTYDATPASIEMAYYRGLLDTNTWDEIVANNCSQKYNSYYEPHGICGTLYFRWSNTVQNIDIYNIYAECPSNVEEALLAAQDPAKRDQMIVNEAGEVLTVAADGTPKMKKGKGYFTQ